jgi:hypothetical protein
MAEFNLGTLPANGTPVFRSNFVGLSDPVDTFSFRLSNDTNINVALTNKNEADVEIIRDFNANGIVDGNDTVVGATHVGGRFDSSATISSLQTNVDAGSYVIRVRGANSTNTNYDLRVSTTPLGQPSNLLPIERDLGQFRQATSGTRLLFKGNTTDTYRFSVGLGAGNFRLSLNGEPGLGGGEANVRLIRDLNNNRVVDAGEEIARSATLGSSTELINRFLSPGDNYYIQVYEAGVSSLYSMTASLG